MMQTGKISERFLKKYIFDNHYFHADKILVGPAVGEDCCVLQIDQPQNWVLSVDPITGTAKNIGELAIHITLNDLAAAGAEPFGVLASLLLPETATEEDVAEIIHQTKSCLANYQVDLLGGHTEVTKAVNQPIMTITGVGRMEKGRWLDSQRAAAGDAIIMTKAAGMEGTSILAYEKEEALTNRFGRHLVERAKAMKEDLSVLPESRLAMTTYPHLKCMHDITEGGVLAGLWEIAGKTGKGLEVNLSDVPIRQETIEISEYYAINPYRLIGSGSMLMITDCPEGLLGLLTEATIPATIVGYLTDGQDKNIRYDGICQSLNPPDRDELYKII